MSHTHAAAPETLFNPRPQAAVAEARRKRMAGPIIDKFLPEFNQAGKAAGNTCHEHYTRSKAKVSGSAVAHCTAWYLAALAALLMACVGRPWESTACYSVDRVWLEACTAHACLCVTLEVVACHLGRT